MCLSARRELLPGFLLHFVFSWDPRVLAAGVTAQLLTPRKYRRTVFTFKSCLFLIMGPGGHIVVVKPLKPIRTSSPPLLHPFNRVLAILDWRTRSCWDIIWKCCVARRFLSSFQNPLFGCFCNFLRYTSLNLNLCILGLWRLYLVANLLGHPAAWWFVVFLKPTDGAGVCTVELVVVWIGR